MAFCFHKRCICGGEGFSLMEVLVTLALIGIIAALLIPNLQQAQQEATRQVVRQQTKVLEKALADWYTSQDNANNATLSAAAVFWAANSDPATGYINTAAGFGALLPYLDGNSGSNFSIDTANYIGAITTAQMQQVQLGKGPYGSTFVTDNVHFPVGNIGCAHAVLYWDLSNKTTASPKVLLFLPNFS